MHPLFVIITTLLQFFLLTSQKLTNEYTVVSTSQKPDFQKLSDILTNLEHRLQCTDALKETNKQLDAVALHINKMQSTLNLINKQIGVLEQKLENLTSKDLTGGKNSLPRHCRDVQNKKAASGMYLIQPEHSPKEFMVFCNMELRGGGWTYFLNRFDGSQNFYLNWTHFKKGFGNLGGEFWLGLEFLHQLTGYEANELLVELSDFDGNTVYAFYNAFVIGSEEEGYPLKVLGGYSGDSGDSLRYHAGMKFTTPDRDQDLRSRTNCAQQEKGSWWHVSCTRSNLCATYLKGPVPENERWRIMYWDDFKSSNYSLKTARMMVKPRSADSSSILHN